MIFHTIKEGICMRGSRIFSGGGEGVQAQLGLSHPFFGNGAGAHGIGKISGVLTKIGNI